MEINVKSGGGGSPSVTHLKAVYAQGEMCGKGSAAAYGDTGFVSLAELSFVNYRDLLLLITFQRINKYGRGVPCCEKPIGCFTYTPENGDADISVYQPLNGVDKITEEFHINTCIADIGSVTRQLISKLPIVGANKSSKETTQIAGIGGFLYSYAVDILLEHACNPPETGTWASVELLSYACLRQDTDGTKFTKAARVKKTQKPLIALVAEAGEEYKNLTWYQLQYAILQTEAPYYVDNDTAKAWIEQYPALAAIAGGDTA